MSGGDRDGMEEEEKGMELTNIHCKWVWSLHIHPFSTPLQHLITLQLAAASTPTVQCVLFMQHPHSQCTNFIHLKQEQVQQLAFSANEN